MSNERKRELIRAYKETTPRRGVCALRCTATGAVWVMASPNLEAQERSLMFMLKNGGHVNRALQQAFNQHGGEAFQFEILAELDGEPRSDYALRADLKTLEPRGLKNWAPRSLLASGAECRLVAFMNLRKIEGARAVVE